MDSHGSVRRSQFQFYLPRLLSWVGAGSGQGAGIDWVSAIRGLQARDARWRWRCASQARPPTKASHVEAWVVESRNGESHGRAYDRPMRPVQIEGTGVD